jgi:NADH:ubiquinone oxidoreductase subunit 4 (subunit M)
MTARALALLAVLLVARVASGEPLPDLALRAKSGALPLELAREGNAWVGELRLENRGAVAVDVRVRPRTGTELLPRLPPTVSANFAGGKAVARIEPGQSQAIVVRWAPGHKRRPRELYGQIEVELDASRRLIAGFHADAVASPLGSRPLSALLVLPLIGLFVLAILGRRRPVTQGLWKVVAAVSGAQLVLAVALHAAFVPALNRYDGNDGFQFIERSVLERGLGIEYALGVDGISIGLVAFVAFAILGFALLGTRWSGRKARPWGFVLLVDLGVMGALVATDLALVLGFFWLSLLGSAALVASAGDREASGAAVRFAPLAAIAFTLVLVACLWIARSAGPSYLVDGTETARTFSLAELSHADLTGQRLVLPYVAIVLGLGALMGLAPLHAWLSGTIARLPAALALLVNLGTVTVASYLLLRLGYGVLPRGTAWAAPALSGLAALSVLWGAFSSAVHGDLRRLLAAAGAVNVGIALLSFSSLTAIGVAGYVVAIQSHTLSMVLWFGLTASLRDRTGSTELDRVGAAVAAAPLLLPIAAVGVLSQLGAPGSLGFVAQMLAIFGAAPLRPLAVAGALFGLIAIAFFQLRRLRSLGVEPGPELGALARPLGVRERTILIASAVAVVMAGVWPAPLFSVIAESALDHAERVNPPGPLEIAEERPERRDLPGRALARTLLNFHEEARRSMALSDSRTDR